MLFRAGYRRAACWASIQPSVASVYAWHGARRAGVAGLRASNIGHSSPFRFARSLASTAFSPSKPKHDHGKKPGVGGSGAASSASRPSWPTARASTAAHTSDSATLVDTKSWYSTSDDASDDASAWIDASPKNRFKLSANFVDKYGRRRCCGL